MDRPARDVFYELIEGAPLAARGFFESVDTHFTRRNDVVVRFTYTSVADLRLWAIWDTSSGKQKEQIFATMTWRPTKETVFARTKLTPEEFELFGFDGSAKDTASDEPQNSEIHLYEEDWRFGVLPFIRALEAAKIKLAG